MRPKTVATYECLAERWAREIKDWSALGLQAYVNRRLQVSVRKTVQTDVSALRGLLRWLVGVGLMVELPDPLPIVEKGKIGKQSTQRTRCRAPDYTAKEIRAFLTKLPERSPGGRWKKADESFLVRPRCELIWELALRPGTADRLSVPEHYRPGATHLHISKDIDKEGVERDLLLTKRAREVLEKYAPESGVIFGEHKYYRHIRKAADGTIGASKAKIFTGQHLRSARATNWLDDRKANIKAVAFVMGHGGNISTTSMYIRTVQRDADLMLGRA